MVTTAFADAMSPAAFSTAAPPSEWPTRSPGAMSRDARYSAAATRSPTFEVKVVLANSPFEWPRPVKSNRRTAIPIIASRAAIRRAAGMSLEQVKQWAKSAVPRCGPSGRSSRAASSWPPCPVKVTRSVGMSLSLVVRGREWAGVATSASLVSECHPGVKSVTKSGRSHQPRVEGIMREILVAGFGDEHLILELDRETAVLGRDQGLGAEHHARFEHRVEGAGRVVVRVVDMGPLVAEAHAVKLAGILLLPELRVELVPAVDEVAERDTGLQQFHVGHDVLVRVAHRVDHGVGGLALAYPPGPRDVDAHAVGADQVCVEGNDLVLLDDPGAAFLEPRVRAGAGGEEAGLDPFAAAADVAGVQFGPDLVL